MSLINKLALFLFSIFAVNLFILPKASFAITIEIQPLNDINNPIQTLNENTAKAKITFAGLLIQDYDVCLGWAHELFVPGDCQESKTIKASEITGGKASIIVCGAYVGVGLFGTTSPRDRPGLKTDCKPSDYFHGHDYAIEIDPAGGEPTKFNRAVNVDVYNPLVDLNPKNPKDTDMLQLTITGSRRPADRKDRNEYKFELTRDDKQLTPPKISDLTVPQSGTVATTFGTLQPGDYTLKVIRKNLENNFDDKALASGGVVASFKIKIDPKGGSINGGTSELGQAGRNPCPGGTSGSCKTAIGSIPTDPPAFVGRILTIALSLAGGIALIIMVIGSIKLLMSAGDPQKVANGRDMIIAAVASLLFLIFSVLILRYLGSNLFPFFTVT